MSNTNFSDLLTQLRQAVITQINDDKKNTQKETKKQETLFDIKLDKTNMDDLYSGMVSISKKTEDTAAPTPTEAPKPAVEVSQPTITEPPKAEEGELKLDKNGKPLTGFSGNKYYQQGVPFTGELFGQKYVDGVKQGAGVNPPTEIVVKPTVTPPVEPTVSPTVEPTVAPEFGSVDYLKNLIYPTKEGVMFLGEFEETGIDDKGRVISMTELRETRTVEIIDGVIQDSMRNVPVANYTVKYLDDNSVELTRTDIETGDVTVTKYDKDGNEIKDTPTIPEGEIGSLKYIESILNTPIPINEYTVETDGSGRVIMLNPTPNPNSFIDMKLYNEESYRISYGDNNEISITPFIATMMGRTETTYTYNADGRLIKEEIYMRGGISSYVPFEVKEIAEDGTYTITKIDGTVTKYDKDGNEIKENPMPKPPVDAPDFGSVDYLKNLIYPNKGDMVAVPLMSFDNVVMDEKNRVTSMTELRPVRTIELIDGVVQDSMRNVPVANYTVKYLDDNVVELTKTDIITGDVTVTKYDKDGNVIKEKPTIPAGELGSKEYFAELLGIDFNSKLVQNVQYDNQGRINTIELSYPLPMSGGIGNELSTVSYTIKYDDWGSFNVTKDAKYVFYDSEKNAEAPITSDITTSFYDADGKLYSSTQVVEKDKLKETTNRSYDNEGNVTYQYYLYDKFDDIGNVIESGNTTTYSDGFTFSRMSNYTYDANNNCIRDEGNEKENGEIVRTFVAQYKYDDENRKIDHEYIVKDLDGNIVQLEKYTNEYYDNGNLKKTTSENSWGDYSTKSSAAYDESGNLIEDTWSHNYNGELYERTGKYEYFNNQLIHSENTTKENGKVTETSVMDAKYNKENQLLSRESVTKDAEGNVIRSSKDVNEYYDNGNLKKSSYESKGQDYTYLNQAEYYENGSLKSSYYFDSWADGSMSKGMTTYYEDGIIKDSSSVQRDADGMTTREVTSKYDEKGNLISTEGKQVVKAGEESWINLNGVQLRLNNPNKENVEVTYTVDGNGQMVLNADGLDISAFQYVLYYKDYVHKRYNDLTEVNSQNVEVIEETGDKDAVLNATNKIKLPYGFGGMPLENITINGNNNNITGTEKDDKITVNGNNNTVDLGAGEDSLKINGSNNKVKNVEDIDMNSSTPKIKPGDVGSDEYFIDVFSKYDNINATSADDKTINLDSMQDKEYDDLGRLISFKTSRGVQIGPNIRGIKREPTNFEIKYNDDGSYRMTSSNIHKYWDTPAGKLTKTHTLNTEIVSDFDKDGNLLSVEKTEIRDGEKTVTKYDAEGKVISTEKYVPLYGLCKGNEYIYDSTPVYSEAADQLDKEVELYAKSYDTEGNEIYVKVQNADGTKVDDVKVIVNVGKEGNVTYSENPVFTKNGANYILNDGITLYTKSTLNTPITSTTDDASAYGEGYSYVQIGYKKV